ncbi:hypothetical protein Cgig2_004437 [Carnegiea gigantea]|uniref:Uncharacterized protein n=1 Tax=Carnegiea gigantea TaxID=171969 RepID=A0A9Q1JUP5_9CARY|nr:hypothetical protein Cgig2_004437 [Carnegiea gigantea]
MLTIQTTMPARSSDVTCTLAINTLLSSGAPATPLQFSASKGSTVSFTIPKCSRLFSPLISEPLDLQDLTLWSLSNNQLVDKLSQGIVDRKKRGGGFSTSGTTISPAMSLFSYTNSYESGRLTSPPARINPCRYEVEYISSEISKSSLVPKRYRLVRFQPEAAITVHLDQIKLVKQLAQSCSSSFPLQQYTSTAKKRRRSWLLGYSVPSRRASWWCFRVSFCSVWEGGLDFDPEERNRPGQAIFSSLIKKAEDLAFLQKDNGLASWKMIGRSRSSELYKAELQGSHGKTDLAPQLASHPGSCPKTQLSFPSHQTVKFTDKCNIYSRGVVLANRVMGKLLGHDFFQHTKEKRGEMDEECHDFKGT